MVVNLILRQKTLWNLKNKNKSANITQDKQTIQIQTVFMKVKNKTNKIKWTEVASGTQFLFHYL